MARTTAPTCTFPASAPTRNEGPRATPLMRDDSLIALARQPWTITAGRSVLLVRPASIRDLPAVARFLHRCSAQSLLDRYRSGGRLPSVAALDRELRAPFTFVVTSSDGEVVATATVDSDPKHAAGAAQLGLLVQDAWQRRYIGTELLIHLAGVAQAAGYTDLVSYPATAVGVAKRMMTEIGRSRFVPGADTHLHTALPDSATLGLGSVRQRLAG